MTLFLIIGGLIAGMAAPGANRRTRTFVLTAGTLWVLAYATISGWILESFSEDARLIICIFLFAYPGVFLFVIGTQSAEQAGYILALEPTVRTVIPDAELKSAGGGDRWLSGSFRGRPATVFMTASSVDGSDPASYILTLNTRGGTGKPWIARCTCKSNRCALSEAEGYRIWTRDKALKRRLEEAGLPAMLCAWSANPVSRSAEDRFHPLVHGDREQGATSVSYELWADAGLPRRLTPTQLEAQLELLAQVAQVSEAVSTIP